MENQVKPAMDRSAPWSPRLMRGVPSRDLDRAVVYVIAPDAGGWCKVGVTTKLKHRVACLQDIFRERLHIHFWLETDKASAMRLETATIAILRQAGIQGRGRETFFTEPVTAAEAIIEARADLGVRVMTTAGFPGAFDPEQNEVEEVLSEPVEMHRLQGRLPREEWCPQSRAVGT